MYAGLLWFIHLFMIALKFSQDLPMFSNDELLVYEVRSNMFDDFPVGQSGLDVALRFVC